MRILNWNIRWGGQGREAEIAGKVKASDADLIVLTEYKNNESGEIITEALAALGYVHSTRSAINRNKNGVAAFSRSPIVAHGHGFRDTENVIVFDWAGIAVIAAFCANDDVTARFIEDVPITDFGKQAVIVGDLNTGPRGSMPDRYLGLDRIAGKGFVDLWRHANKEICWSCRSGNGKSQPDHLLCSLAMKDMRWKIEYDPTTIDEGISDHALMSVDFELRSGKSQSFERMKH